MVNSKLQQLNKARIARSFSRAAESYDNYAQLQRDIGEQLMGLLPSALSSEQVLDLGSGTGYFTRALTQRFQTGEVIGLDLAEGMLRYAAHEHSSIHWLCADAESLPLASDSIDLLFSSLAIQWCENTQALFAELRRILKPGGRAYIATLGPKTLFELRHAWAQVDDYTHVNDFTDVSELSASIQAQGLTCEVHTETRELRYGQLRELTAELKGIGAHNTNRGELTGLSSRTRITAFRQAYEQFRGTDGLLPATYQVYYLSITG